MIIPVVWKFCNIRLVGRNYPPVDAYWLICTQEEAEQQVITRLLPEDRQQYIDMHNQSCRDYQHRFFLVAADLSVILPMPRFFPYSSQWGASNPFRSIVIISILTLEEIPLIEPIPSPTWYDIDRYR